LNYIGMAALTCGNPAQRAPHRGSVSHDVTSRSKLAPASCSAANWLWAYSRVVRLAFLWPNYHD